MQRNAIKGLEACWFISQLFRLDGWEDAGERSLRNMFHSWLSFPTETGANCRFQTWMTWRGSRHTRTPHEGIRRAIRLLRVFSYEKRILSLTENYPYWRHRERCCIFLYAWAEWPSNLAKTCSRQSKHNGIQYRIPHAVHFTRPCSFSVEEERQVTSAVIFHLSFSDSLSKLMRVQRI